MTNLNTTNEMSGIDGHREALALNAETPMAQRYQEVSRAVAKYGDLFRTKRGNGLAMIQRDMEIVQLNTPTALKAAIIDRVDITNIKNGKFSSTGPQALDVPAMMMSVAFLEAIPQLDTIYDQPHYNETFELMQPGENPGSEGFHCYVAAETPPVSDSMERMTAFLDEMNFSTEADRANLVAALLTTLLRNHWPGGKPIVLVTANKSHAGKDTCLDFVASGCRKVSISYELQDWALQSNFSDLMNKSGGDLIVIENAKLGARERVIQSAFIERITTDPNPVFQTPKSRNLDGQPVRNEFVVGISTNDGQVGEDILNRAMVIHLDKSGDIDVRSSKIGNPRQEYLPSYKNEITAEARGMIKRWVDDGKPLDDAAVHPCGPWAKTIGGILKASGIQGFLANRHIHRISHDPMKDALSRLGGDIHGRWLPLPAILGHVAELGLTGALIPKASQESKKSKEHALGMVLGKHESSTFTVETETLILELKLTKTRRRAADDASSNPVVHYRFEVLKSTNLNDEEGEIETSLK